MSRATADEGRGWTNAVARLSTGVGVLYFVGYTVYVLTELDPSFYLPPVVLLGYLLSRSPIDDRYEGTSMLRVVGLYAWVIPAGAVAVELLLLFCQALAFSLLGWIPLVAWYQRQWLSVTGFAGPLPLLVYTLLSAMAVALVAVGIRTVQAGTGSRLLAR